LVAPFTFAHVIDDATPLQYDYVYGSVSSGSFRSNATSGENASAVLVGLKHKFGDSDFLWSMDYGSRFIHLEPETVDLYQLRTGVGYRWLLADKLDLVTDAKIGALRVNSVRKETDFVYSFDVGLRYSLTKKLETALFAETIRNKWNDEYVYTFSADYYFYPKFALGGFMSYRDGEDNVSVREGGIIARFNY